MKTRLIFFIALALEIILCVTGLVLPLVDMKKQHRDGNHRWTPYTHI